MRCFLVCVDFCDLLKITLPYNKHHFDEVHVVTALHDMETQHYMRTQHPEAGLYVTPAFYDDGADFNKWKALEQALDHYGRFGWMCFMDVDILWPKEIPEFRQDKNALYTPRRRMMDPIKLPVPPESEWTKYPVHPQSREWAGYTQVFHAECPYLGKAPWHQINWRHAGGADSFFQAKWPRQAKVRPPFEVLHLGPSGVNWTGRATANVETGMIPVDATEKRQRLLNYIRSRRAGRPDPYANEKLG